jgi:hypothetical protein
MMVAATSEAKATITTITNRVLIGVDPRPDRLFMT